MKLYWQDAETLSKLTESLQKGDVSITTTDTIPGFLVDISEQGFENLNKIKNSRQGKHYIVLIADRSKLSRFLSVRVIPSAINKILLACWPGPLTAIFKATPQIPGFLKEEDGTIALRCPNHQGLLSLLQNFNGLFSTSANISGQPAAKSIDEVGSTLASQVSFLVDDRQSKLAVKPSTILDFSHFDLTGEVFLVREGALPVSDIEKIGGIKIINNLI